MENKLEKALSLIREQGGRRVSIQCIVPPHMLNKIAVQGDKKQRESALNSLLASERIRGRREAFAEFFVATTAGAKCINIFDCKRGTGLPGMPVSNPRASKDKAVKEAYKGADITYNMYNKIYGRNSIDDRGMCLISSVHYSRNYNNAFWDGRQMVYGDGDGDIFERFTKAIDIIGHELTHGVTEYEAGLVYSAQPGALNEHMSDVFGSLVKQYSLKHTADKADWIIGEGIFTKKVNGKGIRSMAAPGTAYDDPVLGKDPQPAHMKDYMDLPNSQDNGGVHINSGIPNHAFYITANEIGGPAWEKAGKIWYKVLIDNLRSNSDFKFAAEQTFVIAGVLFGVGSKEQKAVKSGWSAVGISVG